MVTKTKLFLHIYVFQPLKLSANVNNNEPKILGHGKLERCMAPAEQKRLFLECVDTFLSDESTEVLPLSSPALWQQLLTSASAARSSKDPGLPREALLQLVEVRRDPGVWDHGLQPSYSRFLAQAPGPTLTACLLSIL